MVTVPVFVPSYDLSGVTHRVAVGDRVEWALAVIDEWYVPEFLLQAFEAVTEVAEPLDPPSYWTESLITGSYVRHGSFVAWWQLDHPPGEEVQLRPFCAIGDSRLPEGGIPKATGVVSHLYWALDLLRQRPDGPWDRVPGLGLLEVDSTEVDPEQETFRAYFPSTGVDTNDGRWRHIGWIAMLQCEDAP